MKTILASAYAVNPYKGSEDGMGWNFIYQIARYNKVIAVTRENNHHDIRKYMHDHPNEVYANITFLYFDLPAWMRFWKKGSRGALLYFYLWQRFLPNFVKKQNIQFDIAHNLNFHNDWTPSFLWKLNKPFVWGPIGHHPEIPSEYLSDYKFSYRIKEKLTTLIKTIFWKGSPNIKKCVNNATHVFCMNTSVGNVLDLKNTSHSIAPSVATEDFGFEHQLASNKFKLITAGRLVPLKGFDLTIKAFAAFINNQPSSKDNCELIIVGKGEEKEFYVKLSKRLGIETNVKFIDWIAREDLMKLFKTSSAFVFPSHEGAGMVVAEALSFGLPVVCLDNCGPGEFIDSNCGIKVSYNNNYAETLNALSEAISRLYIFPDLLNRMRLNARKHFEKNFNWDVRGEAFKKVYANIN